MHVLPTHRISHPYFPALPAPHSAPRPPSTPFRHPVPPVRRVHRHSCTRICHSPSTTAHPVGNYSRSVASRPLHRSAPIPPGNPAQLPGCHGDRASRPPQQAPPTSVHPPHPSVLSLSAVAASPLPLPLAVLLPLLLPIPRPPWKPLPLPRLLTRRCGPCDRLRPPTLLLIGDDAAAAAAADGRCCRCRRCCCYCPSATLAPALLAPRKVQRPGVAAAQHAPPFGVPRPPPPPPPPYHARHPRRHTTAAPSPP